MELQGTSQIALVEDQVVKGKRRYFNYDNVTPQVYLRIVG